jgi:flagellar basal-body rod protein FlgC
MIDPLQASLKIAGSGLEVQSARLRIVSENLANAESTGSTPGSTPYVRKTITFASEMDRAAGVELVQVKKIALDPTPFHIEHNPGHPAADQNGDVMLPNINIISEMSDMREANRSYEANLQIVKQARDLISMTINLLSTSA